MWYLEGLRLRFNRSTSLRGMLHDPSTLPKIDSGGNPARENGLDVRWSANIVSH